MHELTFLHVSEFNYIFLNAVLQMLETWLSKESLLSNSFTEKSSSVRQCSKLLHVVVLGPIMNSSVFFRI